MYEWNTAQNEPIMILMLGLLESMLSKPNINIIILFQKKSIHTLENKVLMHQCAISAKDIKQKTSTKGKEYKQPLIAVNGTLIGTLIETLMETLAILKH